MPALVSPVLRVWSVGKVAGGVMGGTGEGDLSFDPRSWTRKSGGPAPEPAASLPPPGRRAKRAAVLVGILVVIAAAAAGFVLMRGQSSPSGQRASETAVKAFRRGMALPSISALSAALQAEGLSPQQSDSIGESARTAMGGANSGLRMVLSLAPGRPPAFQGLELRRADGSGVVVRPGPAGAGLTSEPLPSDLQVRIKVVRGEMDANSFYSSAVAAGVVDSLVADFASAFAFDFDFQREINPGDIFEAAFERHVNGRGEVVGEERLVYASLHTKTKSRALYLYRGEHAQAAWYDGNGASGAGSLMRTPVEGARISSSFGPRMHPVLGYTRIHKGVDFAVPVGAVVYASGDGVIDFVGPHGGHGNYIRIRHSPTLETGYAHLSAFNAGTGVGSSVRQGQAIGQSGNTGLSSGPHLHYEVIQNAMEVDPMTFQAGRGRRLEGPELTAFRKERDRIDALRAAQNS